MRRAILFMLVFFIYGVPAWAKPICAHHQCIEVERVWDIPDMQKGLMGRESLKLNKGMLFVFPVTGTYRFWMKNMHFPIDMIWIDEEGKIVDIKANRPPCEKDPCPSYVPSQMSRYVLEVSAGMAEKWQWRIGTVLSGVKEDGPS